MLSLFRHELLSRWGAILGWGTGLALMGVMYIGIYPQFKEQMGALADIPFYKAFGVDMGSFEGLIASGVLLNLPVILGIYIIVTSSDTLSGEEDRGTLELLVTMPLRRWQIVSMKASALLTATFLMLFIAAVCTTVALAWMNNTEPVSVSLGQMFGSVMSCWPIAVALLMIGLFFSAFCPNRLSASMATTVVLIVSYFLDTLANLVEAVEPIRPLSLFYYFDSSATAYTAGVRLSDVLALFGVAAVFFVFAIISFERRDLTVGRWPWQRARHRA